MKLEISNKTILRILLMVTAFSGIVYLAILVYKQLVWVGIAFFLALALEPAVKRLSRFMPWKSRGLAVSIIFILILGVISLIVITLTPPLYSETQQLIKNAPIYANDFLKSNNPISTYLRTHNLMNQFVANQNQVAQRALSVGGTAVNFLASLFNSIFALITILIFTFFMVLEGPRWMRTFWKYQNPEKVEHRKILAQEMHKTVTGYVNGNILTSIIAAVATGIVLALIGVPYVIAFSILVSILDLIPMVGATLAAIIIVLLSLILKGLSPAIIMLIFFIVYQQIENNLLQPIVYSKSIKISPLVVGIAALFGAIIAGLVGALIAIPLAASLQILIKDYLDRTHLSHQVDGGKTDLEK